MSYPGKCVIYPTTVRGCRWSLSADYNLFQFFRTDNINDMQSTQAYVKLNQFVCAMKRIRSGIPAFPSIFHFLPDLSETFYVLAER